MSRLVVATRKSALALTQCRALLKELVFANPGLDVSELHVVTSGDKIVDRALSDIGGKGLFVKEIEEAILDGRADIAVHSLKDVPAELAPGLELSCIPKREDPRDVIVTRSGCRFLDLPLGSKLGTSSLRRRFQLLQKRPDLVVLPVRGNVDTRLRKCREGVVDAVVLAAAGLRRLGLEEQVTETLETDVCLPAVGQGALAVEQRRGDQPTAEMVGRLRDKATALCVAAERGVMLAVEGNCQTPVAALAELRGEGVRLRAFLAEPDGSRPRSAEKVFPRPASEGEAHTFGQQLGAELKRG